MKTQSTDKLFIYVDSNNLPSMRVAEKCGFEYFRTNKNALKYPDSRTGDGMMFVKHIKED